MLTNYCYVTSIKYQQTNSEEYVASLFSNAVLDGCIVVYEAMYIERMLK